MTLVESFAVGRLRCHLLDAGSQRLDGGAMFGVVPKPLWERRIPADERNRIPLALRCLLVEHDDGLVLVDTGIGNKEPQKFVEIYGVENEGVHGPTRLEDAITEAGFSPTDVAWVINTHLHFDHAGGNTVAAGGESADNREVRPAFPEATYVVQAGELAFARRVNERISASYIEANFSPVEQAGLWQLVEGETELLPGIRLVPTPGHTPFHQSVLVESGGETACYLADLVPTTAHLPLAWIMGYDLEPLVTLETKRDLLCRAEAEGWMLLFEHDPDAGAGMVIRDGKTYAYAPLRA
jgi:glyoxylase-like metal-dependent hydrolase (beta-lactamase superfamily II)